MRAGRGDETGNQIFATGGYHIAMALEKNNAITTIDMSSGCLTDRRDACAMHQNRVRNWRRRCGANRIRIGEELHGHKDCLAQQEVCVSLSCVRDVDMFQIIRSAMLAQKASCGH